MKKLILISILIVGACSEEKEEPTSKPCDNEYTNIVAARCCGMTGPGGEPTSENNPNTCRYYNYCIEYYICTK